MSNYEIINNDIIKWAESYTGEPFHALLCDPPYHLTSIAKRFGKPGSAPAKGDVYRRASAGFMGQEWDGGDIAFKPETWAALGQHLYPGAFGMAFASSRGWHRMAVAIEDAGFIIHPSIFMLGWACGSKFPKATAISNQIDRAAGVERELSKPIVYADGKARKVGSHNGHVGQVDSMIGEEARQWLPATDLAKTWASHRYGGQTLKPALEPIIVFQRPYSGRPVDNITKTGAGALNIDGARVGTAADMNPNDFDDRKRTAPKFSGLYNNGKEGQYLSRSGTVPNGRWPANLLLHHNFDCQPGHCSEGCPVERLGEMSGESESNIRPPTPDNGKDNRGTWQMHPRTEASERGHDDSGTAARYFFQATWHHEILEQLMNADPVYYTAKASKTERSAGLDKPNNHPTVKSLSLTKYLSSLLLPPDAYAPRRILIPFCGVGSEMAGAVLAGFDDVIGIEQSPAYCDIARARLTWWSQWPGWGQTDVDKILQAANDKEAEAGQISLFDLLEAA